MDQDTQIRLVRRVLAHLETRTTDHDDAPTTLDVSLYLDEKRFAREVERIFRGVPLIIAHSSELASPGDFVTHDALGLPLLVVRGDDGVLRAHLNVCRHRGTRLEGATCGKNKKAFTCPYHAWTYARDGSVLHVPHDYGFAGIDRRKRSLTPAPIAVHDTLGFVWLGPAGSDPSSYLGETIARDFEGFGLPTSHVYSRRALTKELGWKLALDVFLESYHLKPTHKDTIYGIFFDNLGLVDKLGPHLRNVFPKRSIRELATQPPESWSLRHHGNVLYHLFPNTLVLVEPDHAAVVHVWPDGPRRTRLETYMLVPEAPATDKARAYWDANDNILHDAVAEDFAMGESIQRGLASGANEEVIFGAYEHALAHFHGTVARMVDGTTGPASDHGGTIT
jgi:phenylpropionate dioxygenase-like ring-hydroxylating dioxygenase large terminal subunit